MFLFNNELTTLKTAINKNNLIECNLTQEINKAGQLSILADLSLYKKTDDGDMIVVHDHDDEYLLFRIVKREALNDRCSILALEYGYYCFSVCDYIKDYRPNDQSMRTVLNKVLENTGWNLGTLDDFSNYTGHFYYQTPLECLSTIGSAKGCEFKFTVAMSNNQITSKRLNVYKHIGRHLHKQFTLGMNALEVVAESDSTSVYKRALGRGKGEEVGDGYGRRIEFADVVWSKSSGNPVDKPKGQNYVEEDLTGNKYILPGNKKPLKIITFDEVEDPNQLLQLTYDWLVNNNRPKLQLKTSVADAGELNLGDYVFITRPDINLRYETRVFRINRNLLNHKLSTVEFGDNIAIKPMDKINDVSNRIEIVDNAIDKVKEDISIVDSTGVKVNYGNNEPKDKKKGDIWFYTTEDGEEILLRWDGEKWVRVVDNKIIEEIETTVDNALKESEQAKQDAINAVNKAEGLVDEFEQSSQKLDEVANKVNSFNGRLEGVSNKVDSVNADLNGIKTNVGQINTDIGNINTDLSITQDKYNTITSRLDSIEANANGNKNLFFDSDNMTDAKYWTIKGGAGKAEIIDGTANIKQNWGGPAYYAEQFNRDYPSLFKVGDDCTFSVDVMVEPRVSLPSDAKLMFYTDSLFENNKFIINFSELEKGKWKRVAVVTKYIGNNDVTGLIRAESTATPSGGYIKLRRPKLEKGNKATDYDSSGVNFSEIYQQIDALKTSVGNNKGQINQIIQTAQGTQNTIKDNTGKIAQLTHAIDGLNSKIENVGKVNPNLLKSTDNMLNTEYWKAKGSAVMYTDYVDVTQAWTGPAYYLSKLEGITENTDYTISFDVKIPADTVYDNNPQLVFYADGIFNTSVVVESFSNIPRNKWTRVKAVIHSGASTTATQGIMRIECNKPMKQGCFKLRKFKLEEGTQMTEETGMFTELKQTIEGVQTTVSNQQGQITQLTQTINGFDKRIEDAEGNVAHAVQTVNGMKQTVEDANKNSAEAVQTSQALIGRVTDAEGRVNEAIQTSQMTQQKVQDLQGNINTITTTVEGTTQRMESVEGTVAEYNKTIDGIKNTVKEQNGKLTSMEQNIDGFKQKVEGIVGTISGINLIGNQDPMPEMTATPSNTKSENKDGFAHFSSTLQGQQVEPSKPLEVQKNEKTKLTQQIEIKTDGKLKQLSFKFQETVVQATIIDKGNNAYVAHATFETINKEKIKVSVISSIELEDGTFVAFRRPKIEEGDYSPYELTATEVDKIVSTTEQVANGFKQTVEDNKNNISSITQKLEGIQHKVQDNEGHITQVTQTVDGLIQKVEDIGKGNPNLFKSPNDFLNTNYWIQKGSSGIEITKEEVRVNAAWTAIAYKIETLENIKKDTDYTISFDIFVSQDANFADATMLAFYSDSLFKSSVVVELIKNIPKGKWTRLHFNTRSNATSGTGIMRVECNSTASSGYFKLRRFKLEEGLKMTTGDEKFTELQQTVEGIQTTVSHNSNEITKVKQTAQGIQTSVSNLEQSTSTKITQLNNLINLQAKKDGPVYPKIDKMHSVDDLYELSDKQSWQGVISFENNSHDGTVRYVIRVSNTGLSKGEKKGIRTKEYFDVSDASQFTLQFKSILRANDTSCAKGYCYIVEYDANKNMIRNNFNWIKYDRVNTEYTNVYKQNLQMNTKYVRPVYVFESTGKAFDFELYDFFCYTNNSGISAQVGIMSDNISLSVKKGEVINAINVSTEGVTISGEKLHITARTTIDNAVIKDAMIQNISASKITTGTIDASKVNVINLNANNIIGNKTSFVQSAWNGINSGVYLDSGGLKIKSSNGENILFTNGTLQFRDRNNRELVGISRFSNGMVNLSVTKGNTFSINYDGQNDTDNTFMPALTFGGTNGTIRFASQLIEFQSAKARFNTMGLDGSTCPNIGSASGKVNIAWGDRELFLGNADQFYRLSDIVKGSYISRTNNQFTFGNSSIRFQSQPIRFKEMNAFNEVMPDIGSESGKVNIGFGRDELYLGNADNFYKLRDLRDGKHIRALTDGSSKNLKIGGTNAAGDDSIHLSNNWGDVKICWGYNDLWFKDSHDNYVWSLNQILKACRLR